MASKRQKKKQIKLKVQKAQKIRARKIDTKIGGRKERRAAEKELLLRSLRTPHMYEGKLEDNASYYAAIKKYKEYVDRGLIKPSSNLDKYDVADAFYSTLSTSEQMEVMQAGIEKAEEIMAREREEAATFAQRTFERYGF